VAATVIDLAPTDTPGHVLVRLDAEGTPCSPASPNARRPGWTSARPGGACPDQGRGAARLNGAGRILQSRPGCQPAYPQVRHFSQNPGYLYYFDNSTCISGKSKGKSRYTKNHKNNICDGTHSKITMKHATLLTAILAAFAANAHAAAQPSTT
jgi:hypothetical protein